MSTLPSVQNQEQIQNQDQSRDLTGRRKSAPAEPTTDTTYAATIVNPVLPGFHPDPSILRVGEDYYIATSTFEWLPGVCVHHSRDLVNWTPLGGVLREQRLIELSGRPDSGGVWAPCLSYADGLFHLVYSDVTNLSGAFKDVHNRVTTAPALDGPWSDPAPFPSHGFDPSLFHDDGPDGDGRSWALWMQWDHRPGRHPFAGILLQEWDRAERRVTGPAHRIFGGTRLAHTEGPHLYRRDGWYYLVTAEGGTSWGHAVTVARSRRITGPYEADPAGPVLTSAGQEGLALQKAGHGSLVETPGGEWYLAHLMARPLSPLGPCVLGRETALQRVEWTAEGWPRLGGGRLGGGWPGGGRPAGDRDDAVPRTTVRGPRLPPAPVVRPPARDDFDRAELATPWSTLRRHPGPSWLTLTERPGHLRLRGGQSPGSTHGQSLVARRQQSLRFDFAAHLAAEPRSPLQMAGIVHYYNSGLWHYLHLTWDEELGRVLRVGVCAHGEYSEPTAPVTVPDGPLELRLAVREARGNFFWRAAQDTTPGTVQDTTPGTVQDTTPGTTPGTAWQPVGPELDVTRLSDESATQGDPATGHFTAWGFTGAFAGLCAQDLTGAGMTADFDWAEYREVEYMESEDHETEDRETASDPGERP